MKQVENKIVNHEIVTYICDRCKVKETYRNCCMCGRDLCADCGYYVEFDGYLDEPDFNSDYPDLICKECWEKGLEIRKTIKVLREDKEKKEEDLFNKWQEICQQKGV